VIADQGGTSNSPTIGRSSPAKRREITMNREEIAPEPRPDAALPAGFDPQHAAAISVLWNVTRSTRPPRASVKPRRRDVDRLEREIQETRAELRKIKSSRVWRSYQSIRRAVVGARRVSSRFSIGARSKAKASDRSN
jgi:hypothetical protein